MLHTLRFSLKNAVYFIMLPFLVHVLFTSYIQNVLKVKCKIKVCKSVHQRTIQINHQPAATVFQFIILTFVYSSTCFGRFPAHHQELNGCSGSRPARPTTNTARLSPRYEGKPEAATAVIELLMMGEKTPETC
jgi:hypothetical protein